MARRRSETLQVLMNGILVGALQIVPEGHSPEVRAVQATPISDRDIGHILRSCRSVPLGIDLEADFRLSVAGVQEKTAFLWYRNTWHRPAGATPTSHLFKLPIGTLGASGIDLRDSIDNEWLCCQILKEFGLPVAHTTIQMFDGQRVLVVERFDRRWAEDGSWLIRLPQEDMCQALGKSAALKYEAKNLHGHGGTREKPPLPLGHDLPAALAGNSQKMSIPGR